MHRYLSGDGVHYFFLPIISLFPFPFIVHLTHADPISTLPVSVFLGRCWGFLLLLGGVGESLIEKEPSSRMVSFAPLVFDLI